jgi:hypothetical protein
MQEIIPVVCDPLTPEGRAVWGPIAAVADAGEPLLCLYHSRSAKHSHRLFRHRHRRQGPVSCQSLQVTHLWETRRRAQTHLHLYRGVMVMGPKREWP